MYMTKWEEMNTFASTVSRYGEDGQYGGRICGPFKVSDEGVGQALLQGPGFSIQYNILGNYRFLDGDWETFQKHLTPKGPPSPPGL